MRILFVNKTRENEFRGFDHTSLEGMRGAERTVIQLADALGKRGHDVVVTCASAAAAVKIGQVTIADPSTALAGRYDVAVSNNFAKAFDNFDARAKVVWTHNPGFSRAHIQADLLAKLRYRPYLVHLSDYTRRRSWFLPQSGCSTIRHGMPAELIAERRERAEVPAPVAVFSSYAGRNLSRVIKAWRDVVHKDMPGARLLITSEAEPKHLAGMSSADLASNNIEILGTLPWTRLMELLRTARVFVAPGHPQETFNLLTVEAAACGLPTVTMGIGALRERVVPDETGWIAGSNAEMGQALVRVLSDDVLWARYHRGALQHPDLVTWEQRAVEWELLLDDLLSNGARTT
jgi:glycosyltransferase involved in cell wall biosynthesis